MWLIARSTFKAFWSGKSAYVDARESTLAWCRHVLKGDWQSPPDDKRDFCSASVLRDGRGFNIAGYKYRLVVWINYPYRVVYIGSSARMPGTSA